MDGYLKEFTKHYCQTAAGCNAQKELPTATLVRQIIETATEHANILGIGYNELIRENNAWVLSRLAIELNRMPRMHEDYSLTTWIDSFNRHFSRRNFVLESSSGEILGYISTVWVAINIESRRPADLSSIADMEKMTFQRECRVTSKGRIKPDMRHDIAKSYLFATTDIDFNRHVTTARYVELIENQFDLDFYDRNEITHFEINFHHESVWGEQVDIYTQLNEATGESYSMIHSEKNGTVCTSITTFRPRIKIA